MSTTIQQILHVLAQVADALDLARFAPLVQLLGHVVQTVLDAMR